MVAQVASSVENNFTKGLITEATGLNFPENACTSTTNCDFTIIGDIMRREGIDYENNFSTVNLGNRSGNAISTYVWNNAGGDGQTKIVVVQNGSTIYFYSLANATVTSPLSSQKLSSTVLMSKFTASGGTFDASVECTYTDGNGYLFIFNSNCDPVFCTYNSGTITASSIQLNIRDFNGIPDGLQVNARPSTLSSEHQYNLQNQGWTSGNAWETQSSDVQSITTGLRSWTVNAVSGVTVGQIVNVRGTAAGSPYYCTATGSVYSYGGNTLVLDITSFFDNSGGLTFSTWVFDPTSTGYISSWHTAEGNYPSNADVWWYFKDQTNAFNPSSTQPNVTLSVGNAPQGHYLLNAFNQDRTAASGTTGITPITTTKRPSNGTWFQGRVWYTGVSASQASTGDATFYTWSENIYFSQVNLGLSLNFGNCYQINDPTSENLFSILPTDGGVIQIQGAGNIYKLFPVQNGMLVFAANGVWFITGSQGIGFAANDYTITKISSIQTLSSYSFVDVFGMPYFWNLEGIYQVQPSQSGSLQVNPITVGTIKSFYNSIPTLSKQYARGVYDPINYVIQWAYKTTAEVSVQDRYTFDGLLNLNTYTKAFYPYIVNITNAGINSIFYMQPIETTTSPVPSIKYFVSFEQLYTFGDEHDTTYVDWNSSIPVNYTSQFITGYKLHGQGQKRFQIPYIYFYSRNTNPTSYYIQGTWDYATASGSNRWSVKQYINITDTNVGVAIRRHRIRGMGLVLQLMVTSVDGQPFDIMGWSINENINAGV